VLRFWNHDVLRDTEAVLEAIYQAIEAKRRMTPSPPAPLPAGEGSAAHAPLPDALKPFFSGQQGWDEGAYLPPELWNLFPDRLDDDGKPEGWEMQPLSELLTIIGGGTPKTSVEEYWGGDIPWFSVVDTPSASDVFVVATEKTITAHGLARSSARLIPKGATIISARGTVGNLAIAGREMTFNQSCYGLRGTGSAGDYFVYLTAQQMVDQLKSMAHGSVFSTITRQTFEAIQRPVPPSVVLTAFEGLVTGWFDAILANVEESRILAQLRDTLLPKLISGELRIADADRFLGQVGQA
jgi:type I restriction enzyme S subunit